MQQAEYQIVPYRPEHQARVIELQMSLWSPSAELNAAYLEWKHLRNPYTTEPLIYLAMHGTRVVGMRGFYGAKWEFGSTRQTLLAPCAGDMVISPDHRNRGLMTKIMKAAFHDLAAKGYTYVFSMSAGSMTLLSQMAMGWRRVGALQLMTCIVTEKKSLSSAREFLKKFPLAVSVYRRLRGIRAIAPPDSTSQTSVNHFDTFDWRSEQRGHKIGDRVSIQKVPRPQDMAELVGRVEYDGRIRHVQDEPHFAWRFQNPRSIYRFLFWEDNRLEGYLVLQATALSWMPQISIVDWKATTHSTRTELLQAAIQLVGPGTISIWSATLSEEERRILETAGFERVTTAITNDPPTAVVRPVRDDMLNQEWRVGTQKLLDLNNWDFRMIYSEGY